MSSLTPFYCPLGSPEVADPLLIVMRMASRLCNGSSYHAYVLFVDMIVLLLQFWIAFNEKQSTKLKYTTLLFTVQCMQL